MKKSFVITFLVPFAVATAQGAVTTQQSTSLLSSSQNDVGSAVIDLTDGSATFGGDGSGVPTTALGDGTVSEYLFVNAVGVSDASSGSLNVFTSSGSSISTPTFPADTITGNKSNVELTLPDGTTVFTSNTGANASDVSGTIDVSGYNSGTIFFVFGTSADYAQVALDGEISGFLGTGDSGAPYAGGGPFDFTGTTVGGNGTAITAFSFDNQADSFADTTLDYRAINTDLDGSRARFYGIIIDGTPVPEPSSAALLGLGALALLARRR